VAPALQKFPRATTSRITNAEPISGFQMECSKVNFREVRWSLGHNDTGRNLIAPR
jgi:hypothetical protein